MSFTRSVKFLGQSIIVKYTYGTLVGISPLDRAPGHFGQGIIVIKLILVDFDGKYYFKNLHRCSLYTCLCCVKLLAPFLEKHLIYEGGAELIPPPLPILNTSRRCLL